MNVICKIFSLAAIIFNFIFVSNLTSGSESNGHCNVISNDFDLKNNTTSESQQGKYFVFEGIHVLLLEGSHYEMGKAYG